MIGLQSCEKIAAKSVTKKGERSLKHKSKRAFPLMRLLGSQKVVVAQSTVIVWRGV